MKYIYDFGIRVLCYHSENKLKKFIKAVSDIYKQYNTILNKKYIYEKKAGDFFSCFCILLTSW